MAAWTVINHTELGAAAAEWDVTSIPTDGTYDHLYAVVSARTDASVYVDQWGLRFNDDSAGNYSSTFFYAGTTTPTGGRGSAQNGVQFLYGAAGASAGANVFGMMTFWVPHYANSANDKSVMSRWGTSNNSATDNQWFMGTTAGLGQDTSAIDQITVYDVSGDDFTEYSTFTLYGVTGA